jgi:eukaryotic-like serine/threonine-protein kinase
MEMHAMPIDPLRVQAIFIQAVTFTEEADRKAYLDRECEGDFELRSEVERLLFNQNQPSIEFAPSIPTATYVESDRPVSVATGEHIPGAVTPVVVASSKKKLPTERVIAGRYTLVEVIGEGGMGAVYLAEQTEPVKRQVALKLIKSGMDSNSVLARFDAERQALALMDHPNIARIYDGGVTPSGQPFFVMELVKGIPLTEYCDQQRLSVQERLSLFVQVCHAVQHAHQKGIIHRDLKPGNVLVTEVDGRPTPKVIDFGVAKATEQKLTKMTFSDVGAIVGTPSYMSPEQADPTSMDIDTRTDVYALGVMLYELLAGSPPIDASQFKRGAILEMLRMVREVEPPRPSSKLSTADALPNIAANRHIEPRKLSKLLRGELDWVVMKALEKDRNRRYETANGFAADIQRYLADEVVEARPPTRGYRLRKFVRRNQIEVIAASMVLFTLVAGITGTTIGLFRAQKAELKANNERDAKGIALQEAVTNLDFSRKGNKILGSVFEDLRPEEIAKSVRPLQDVLKDNLKLAVKELDGSAIGDPLVVAEMQNTLGRSLFTLGEVGLAIEILGRARATRLRLLGTEHPDTLTCMGNLALAYQAAGKLDLALPLFEETLKLCKAKPGLDHRSMLLNMNNLAGAYQAAGKLDLAIPLFEETLKLCKAKPGLDHPLTFTIMNNLAQAYQADGKLDLAIPLIEETLKLCKAKLGLKHPLTFTTMNNLAGAYQAAEKWGMALPLFEEALKHQKAQLGPDHPDTLISMHNLAGTYQDAGKLDLALPLCEESLKLMKAKFGPDHPHTLKSMGILADVYQDVGNLDLALPLIEETLKLRKAKFGPEHSDTLISMNNLAVAYQAAGKLDLALPLYEDTLEVRKATLGHEHTLTLASTGNLAKAYLAAGKLDLALPLFVETLKLTTAKLGPDHTDTFESMNNLAQAYREAGKLDLALPLFVETLKLRKAKFGPDHSATHATMANLAQAYQDSGILVLALPLLEETLKLRIAKFGPEHSDTLISMNNLALAYLLDKQLDKSIPLFEKTLKFQEAKLGRNHPYTLNTLTNLGVTYKEAGRLQEAIPLLEEAYQASKKHLSLRAVAGHLLEACAKAGEKAKFAVLLNEQLAEARKTLPKESPELAGQLAMSSFTLMELKVWADAEPLLRECLAIREKTQPDVWPTFNTMSTLGGALLGQKKFSDAEPLLLKGYEGMKIREKTIPPQGGTRIPEAIDRLIDLYTETKKPDEVKKWQAERNKYPTPKEIAPMPRVVK